MWCIFVLVFHRVVATFAISFVLSSSEAVDVLLPLELRSPEMLRGAGASTGSGSEAVNAEAAVGADSMDSSRVMIR